MTETLTAFQTDLLAAVAALEQDEETGPHGLAVKESLEGLDKYGEIHHGRLYPNLDTLVEEDYLTKGVEDRRTNYYTTTKKGRDHLTRRANLLTSFKDE